MFNGVKFVRGDFNINMICRKRFLVFFVRFNLLMCRFLCYVLGAEVIYKEVKRSG